MGQALLIIAIVTLSLVCPVMTLLGRRGIGPGCVGSSCRPKDGDEIEALQERQRELARRVRDLEASTPASEA